VEPTKNLIIPTFIEHTHRGGARVGILFSRLLKTASSAWGHADQRNDVANSHQRAASCLLGVGDPEPMEQMMYINLAGRTRHGPGLAIFTP